MVVGEVSGDALAADLIRVLRQKNPNLIVEGIIGPKLIEMGYQSLFPMDRLSVMGFWEPLKRLPELISIRQKLKTHFINNPPDIFIGVDSPDFNLGLERALRKRNIRTAHYVSPSVWAWRQGRVKGIQKSVNLMLTLFPFEADFYTQHQVPVCFTGHPYADQIPLTIDVSASKKTLNFEPTQSIITLLPGSRNNELKYLSQVFCLTARWCYAKRPDLVFLVPLVSEKHKIYFETIAKTYAPEVPIKTMVGRTREAISAANAVLVTSGTATLEVMLHKKPMVVAYRLFPLTFHLMKRLVKVPYIALPNLLAKERLVPEFIQDAAEPEVMGRVLLEYLESPKEVEQYERRFTELHQELRCHASETAAEALLKIFSE